MATTQLCLQPLGFESELCFRCRQQTCVPRPLAAAWAPGLPLSLGQT
jgi:hypothetical protein